MDISNYYKESYMQTFAAYNTCKYNNSNFAAMNTNAALSQLFYKQKVLASNKSISESSNTRL